jgi:hypothetical protein
MRMKFMNKSCMTGEVSKWKHIIAHTVIKRSWENIITFERHTKVESQKRVPCIYYNKRQCVSQLTPPSSHNSHLSPLDIKHQKGRPNLETRRRRTRGRRIMARRAISVKSGIVSEFVSDLGSAREAGAVAYSDVGTLEGLDCGAWDAGAEAGAGTETATARVGIAETGGTSGWTLTTLTA